MGARRDVLDTASAVVTGQRDVAYGHPEDSFGDIARLWSAYLQAPVTQTDVAALMVLLKLARLRTNPTHFDSAVDVAGYAACLHEVAVGIYGDQAR